MNISAHIPADSRGFRPVVPGYGNYNISASANSDSPRFTSIDAAITAATKWSDTYDMYGGAVFQAKDGAYLIGSAVFEGDSETGPEYPTLPSKHASQIVFDDPTLMALISNGNVFRR